MHAYATPEHPPRDDRGRHVPVRVRHVISPEDKQAGVAPNPISTAGFGSSRTGSIIPLLGV
jgi:hypothetical protein